MKRFLKKQAENIDTKQDFQSIEQMASYFDDQYKKVDKIVKK